MRDWFRRVILALCVSVAGCVAPSAEVFGGKPVGMIDASVSPERVLEMARELLGPQRAYTLAELLGRNVPESIPLANLPGFDSRRAELAAARRWLEFIRAVRDARSALEAMTLLDRARALIRAAPFGFDPRPILEHRRSFVRAARISKLPVEVLAAIVDNEQSGGQLALGLSGASRALADQLALGESRLMGRSSLFGGFSQTLGLSQMSWRDALLQGPRLRAMGAKFQAPFPRLEPEVRALLERDDANLILTASRLRGYLNASLGRASLDLSAFPRGWASLEGPLWHNRPDLARAGKVNAYAFHAFFKACVYAMLIGGRLAD